jgi:two-component system C4-dicarboxylate transport sensor histidine kinase DctB
MYTARLASTRLAAERGRALSRHATELAHELGGPLRVLERRSHRLLERADDPSLVRLEAQKLEAVSKQLLGAVYDMAAQATWEIPEPERATPLRDAILAAALVLDSSDDNSQVLLSLSPALPGTTEPDAVTRALVNILDNALEASEPGQPVWIYATCEQGQARIQIRDSGRGMPSEVLERALDLHFTTKNSGESMGLGLSISREIIEELGGKIELESCLEEGTVVTVTLPAERGGAQG